MKRIAYKCTLLTPLIMSSSSATDGNHLSLDYIPGSKFLGIVAKKNYDTAFPQRTLDLFHNGTVRFGDAHPYLPSGERLERMPMSWQMPKGEEDGKTIYLHHNLSDTQKKELVNDGIQLKQAKGKYFSASNHSLKVSQNFSMKSAYDLTQFRAKKGQMFGYSTLPKGSTWSFTVEFDQDHYTELVNKTLEGKHRLGRSKSAEYGMVAIEKIAEVPKSGEDYASGETYLYAASNLCFYDEKGKSTLKPSLAQLKLPNDSTILWDKSQIRSRSYRTWNGKRGNRDADRLVIQKGSVFVIHLNSTLESSVFDKGVGSHRSEGFGRIYLSPYFLKGDEPLSEISLTKYQEEDWKQLTLPIIENGAEDAALLHFIANKVARAKAENRINERVNQFVSDPTFDLKGISRSQWGQIRKYAKIAVNANILQNLLLNTEYGFCYNGQSKKEWQKKGRRDALKQFLFENEEVQGDKILELAIKLAAELAK